MFEASYHHAKPAARFAFLRSAKGPTKWPWSGDVLILRYSTPEKAVIECRMERTYSGLVHQLGHPSKHTYRFTTLWYFTKPWVSEHSGKHSYGSLPKTIMTEAAEHPNSPIQNVLEAHLWVDEHAEAAQALIAPLESCFLEWSEPLHKSLKGQNFKRALAGRRAELASLLEKVRNEVDLTLL